MDEATKSLVDEGVLGACLVIALLALAFLFKAYKDSQDKRIADAQNITLKFLELNDKWNATISESTKASAAQKDALRALELQVTSVATETKIIASKVG